MNLRIISGDTPLSQTSKKHNHHEPEFDIEMTDTGLLYVRARGGAPFITVNPEKKEYVIDVLNFPHIDVGRVKADMEKKEKAEKERKEKAKEGKK